MMITQLDVVLSSSSLFLDARHSALSVATKSSQASTVLRSTFFVLETERLGWRYAGCFSRVSTEGVLGTGTTYSVSIGSRGGLRYCVDAWLLRRRRT